MKCFVIIGFGKKTSYANGRVRELDLDETYELLIKPAFEELDITCERAIDINSSGSIDKIMLEAIATADFVAADISTLNANVMWELGVRHALRPYHTIILAEKEQMSGLPFDLQHFVVHEYVHSDVGIPYKEVPRFKEHLKELVRVIIAQRAKHSDSPVHTFLGNRLDVHIRTGEPEDVVRGRFEGESLASLLKGAEAAQKKKEYGNAIALLKRAKHLSEESSTLMPHQSLIIERLALCTYKLGQPDLRSALLEAEQILSVLNPLSSQDEKILGLSGSIQKHLFKLTEESVHLDSAIQYYQRGFLLKRDYYNGINLVFCLIQKADLQKKEGKENWRNTFDAALYFCDETQLIVQNSLQTKDTTSPPPKDLIWILLTFAEVHHYLGNYVDMAKYESLAKEEAVAEEEENSFALTSYFEQRGQIIKILHRLISRKMLIDMKKYNRIKYFLILLFGIALILALLLRCISCFTATHPDQIDTDMDRIADKLDRCPEEYGIELFNGCPDKDGDLVEDDIDRNPSDSGKIEWGGADFPPAEDPNGDDDKDGTLNKDDSCRFQRGPRENRGCHEPLGTPVTPPTPPVPAVEDQDNDGFVNQEDPCPELPGESGKPCPWQIADYNKSSKEMNGLCASLEASFSKYSGILKTLVISQDYNEDDVFMDKRLVEIRGNILQEFSKYENDYRPRTLKGKPNQVFVFKNRAFNDNPNAFFKAIQEEYRKIRPEGLRGNPGFKFITISLDRNNCQFVNSPSGKMTPYKMVVKLLK